MPKVPKKPAGQKSVAVTSVLHAPGHQVREGSVETTSVVQPLATLATEPFGESLARLLVAEVRKSLVRVSESVVVPQPSEPASFAVAQTVTSAGKALVFLHPGPQGMVVKGPMQPGVAAKVRQRCEIFGRPSWAPGTFVSWTVFVVDGETWMYTRNLDEENRLPGRVSWERVYCYKPSGFTGDFFGCVAGAGAGGGEPQPKVAVWAWRAVRGSLPVDSRANRVSDMFNLHKTPDKWPSFKVLENIFLHLCFRFILQCGDSGFHNCLMGEAGVGIDFEDDRSLQSSTNAATVQDCFAPAGKLGKKEHQMHVAAALNACLERLHRVVSGADLSGLAPMSLFWHGKLVGLLAKELAALGRE